MNKRIVITCLLFALVTLQYKLWVGDASVPEWVQVERKLASQQQENARLSERNQVLEADINGLKSGDQALEEQARYELGMVKQGETYYQFIE